MNARARPLLERLDRILLGRSWLDRAVVDAQGSVRRLLHSPHLAEGLRLRARLAPILPPRPAGTEAGRSIVFVHNSYYHFTLMAAALRRRGWDALSLQPSQSVEGDAFLHHGEDVSVRFDGSPRSLLEGAQLVMEIADRFGAVHFYGVNNMAINPLLNMDGLRAAAPAFPLEFDFLKRRGLKIGYSVVGCNDGIGQATWDRWTGGMCGHCAFRSQADVCSEMRNLGWGQRLVTMADIVFGEMMPRLDFLANPKVRSFPCSYTVDPDRWRPDLEVPAQHRIDRQPGEVLVLHGFAKRGARVGDGADPKGTRAIHAAIARLQAEGLPVRLVFLDGIPSRDVRFYQVQADIVVDQLRFGRYGAQGRECLMLGKPVVGHLKRDGGETGLAAQAIRECPIVDATPETITDVLRDLIKDPARRRAIGEASRAYALKWHATGAGADRFEREYARIGLGRKGPDLPRKAMYKIPLIRPIVTEAVKQRVNAVLDSRFLSEGPVTREFESKVSDFLGGGHVLAVTSATTGLELALRALDVGPGDEVVVPDFTYPATADVVSIVGATVVLVDVDRRTMTMDMDALDRAITPATKVVMPVPAFGNPVDFHRLNELKARHGFKVVEDAAPALGAELDGRKVGRWADVSVFSLHPRKMITTGEGGLVVTDDAALADWMKSYKHFGMGVENGQLRPFFQRIGTNYKLSDILSAVGLAQMEMIDGILERRRSLSARYDELLAGIDGIELPATTSGGLHSRQSYAIFVEERDRILRHMRALGIEVQIGTYALHREQAFAPAPGVRVQHPLTGSLHAYDHCLVLPLYHDMTVDEQDTVVRELAAIL